MIDIDQIEQEAVERIKFEAWATKEGFYFDRHKSKPDEYENGAAQDAWQSWLARSKQDAAVRDALLASERLCDELGRILWDGEPLKWPEIRKLRDDARAKLSRVNAPTPSASTIDGAVDAYFAHAKKVCENCGGTKDAPRYISADGERIYTFEHYGAVRCSRDLHALPLPAAPASAVDRLKGMPEHFHFGGEAIAALEAVGMGKPGRSNCLIDMILEACETIRSLRSPTAPAHDAVREARERFYEAATRRAAAWKALRQPGVRGAEYERALADYDAAVHEADATYDAWQALAAERATSGKAP